MPLALLLIGVATAAIGFLSALQAHRGTVNVQLELDACVGKAALELRAHLESLEKTNVRMRQVRTAAAAAVILLPEALEATRTALQGLALAQDARRTRWQIRKAEWLLRNGCQTGAAPRPLPDLPFHRPPPDALGPRPLERTGKPDLKPELQITLHHRRGKSSATVRHVSAAGKAEWHAEWTPANRARRFGTDLH